jgi:murein DD-endopeptidase MepM/ murein hydrolase activator NlpD
MKVAVCRNPLNQGGIKMRRGFILLGFLLCTMMLWDSAVAYADGENAEKGNLQQLIQQVRKSIQLKKKKEQSVLGNLTKQQKELSRLEQNYGHIKNQLDQTQNKLKNTKRELNHLQVQLSKLGSDLQTRQQLLNQRIVVIYKHGFQSYLELLLNAHNFGDFINRYETLSYFISNDLRLIDQIQNTKLDIKSRHIAIETKRQQEEHQFKKIAVLQEEADREQRKMSKKVGRTKEELTKIQQDRASLEKALDEYEKTSREIEASIRKDEQKGTGELGTGHMIWPVRGRLSSSFGWRYHPVLRKKKLHNGQDIAVPSGTPVLAADSGVVLVSGWQGGYGNFVAIDHGNGISTCYGHNSRLLVQVGDKVQKGQTIALSGSTGLSTGPHVHFEVRRNGTPINPLPYLP